MAINVIFNNNLNPWHNIAWEESLLKSVSKNTKDIYLYFYESLDSIILGASLKKEDEVYSHKHHPPVLRRVSGGGSVIHFRNNINYGILFSLDSYPNFFKIQDSYNLILGSIIKESKTFSSPLFLNGLSDLTVMQAGSQRKISGNSQARKNGLLLHHGTFLCKHTNISKIKYFLKPPLKQPEYRLKRSHQDFLLLVSPFYKEQIIRMILQSIQNLFFLPIISVSSFTENQLVIDKEILSTLNR